MSHRKTRRYHRNPTTATWLILGAAVAGVAAYAIFSKKGTTPAPTPPGTLPVTPGAPGVPLPANNLGDACKQKLLAVLPLAVLTAQDAAVCKANPQAQECLRATANAATVQAWSADARATCIPGTPGYTGTLPPLPTGLPTPSADCQANYLAYMALAAQVAQSGNITPDLQNQANTLLAQLDKVCGANLN